MDGKLKQQSSKSTVFSRLDPVFDSFSEPYAPPAKKRLIVPSHSDHVECRSFTGPGHTDDILKNQMIAFTPVPTFDCDVDGMFSLSPIDMGSTGTFQNNPMLSSTPSHKAPRKNSESGQGQVERGQEGQRKVVYLNETDEVEDEGYFSMFHKKDKSSSQSGYNQLPTATSSPQPGTHRARDPWKATCPESTSDPDVISKHVSFPVSDFSTTVNGIPQQAVDCLEDDDVEGVWAIGPPRFESSMCHSVTVKLSTDGEQRRWVTQDVQRSALEPSPDCLTTVSDVEATTDSSFETSFSPQVQVKSVVVVPSQSRTTTTTTSSSRSCFRSRATTTTTTSNSSSKSTTSSRTSTNASARCVNPAPLIPGPRDGIRGGYSGKRKREEDMEMERKKQSYVNCVTRHMNEKPSSVKDAISELLNLMSKVAERKPDSKGVPWQHPADLTRRNYLQRFGRSTPQLSLNEWNVRNSRDPRRFDHVPKIFNRSPFL